MKDERRQQIPHPPETGRDPMISRRRFLSLTSSLVAAAVACPSVLLSSPLCDVCGRPTDHTAPDDGRTSSQRCRRCSRKVDAEWWNREIRARQRSIRSEIRQLQMDAESLRFGAVA